MLDFYRPSGRLSPAVAPMFLLTLALGVAIGVAHTAAILFGSFLLQSRPLIILAVFAITIGVATIALVAINAKLLAWAGCRHGKIAPLLGLLVGLAAIVAAHLALYLWTIHNLPAANAPDFLAHLQQRAAPSSPGGPPIVTPLYWTGWVIEALGYLGAGWLGGLVAVDTPYCERCNSLATRPALLFRVPGISDRTIQAISKADDLADLLSPPLHEIAESPYALRYTTRTCRCGNSTFLTLAVVSEEVERTGKVIERAHELHRARAIVLDARDNAAVEQLAVDVGDILADRR